MLRMEGRTTPKVLEAGSSLDFRVGSEEGREGGREGG